MTIFLLTAPWRGVKNAFAVRRSSLSLLRIDILFVVRHRTCVGR